MATFSFGFRSAANQEYKCNFSHVSVCMQLPLLSNIVATTLDVCQPEYALKLACRKRLMIIITQVAATVRLKGSVAILITTLPQLQHVAVFVARLQMAILLFPGCLRYPEIRQRQVVFSVAERISRLAFSQCHQMWVYQS